MLHDSQDYFGKSSEQNSIKYVLRGPVGSRYKSVKKYKKSKYKWKKDLKSLRKKNKILYRIAKKSGSRRELKISRRSRLSLLRSATIISATLSSTNTIPNYPYPVIVHDMKIDSLLYLGI